MYRPHLSVPLAVIVAGIAGASSAHATVRVGYAMMVERNVSGTLSGQQRKVLKGDDVFENDFIRTETESSAGLRFVDKTQLMLGPRAIAKLDRLVFNPDQSVSALTLSARQGAVRWISGESASSAYRIETSTVTIRPQGTMFDVLVEPQRTTVVLQEGIIEVCLISAPQRCRVLSRRGELITATLNAIEAPQPGGPGSSDFEDRCLSAAGNGCVIGISVNPPPERSPKPGVGQKRAEPRAPSNTPKQTYDPPQPPSSVAVVDPTPVVNPVPPGVIPPSVIVIPSKSPHQDSPLPPKPPAPTLSNDTVPPKSPPQEPKPPQLKPPPPKPLGVKPPPPKPLGDGYFSDTVQQPTEQLAQPTGTMSSGPRQRVPQTGRESKITYQLRSPSQELERIRSSGFRHVGGRVLRAPVTAAALAARANIPSNAVKLSTPRVTNLHVSTPKVNVSTPKVNVSTPKVNVSTPKVNVSTPSLNISKVTPQVATPRVSAPHVTVKALTIRVPTVPVPTIR